MQENILEEVSAQKATLLTERKREEKRSERGKGDTCVTKSDLLLGHATVLLQSSLINRSSLFASSFLSAMSHVCWRRSDQIFASCPRLTSAADGS